MQTHYTTIDFGTDDRKMCHIYRDLHLSLGQAVNFLFKSLYGTKHYDD